MSSHNFNIICCDCGSTNITVDAFHKTRQAMMITNIALPLLICENCGNEWNPLIKSTLKSINNVIKNNE